MMDERRFPIQGESVKTTEGDGFERRSRREPGWVPWGIAEVAYAEYARLYGTGQSLERLAERGGFGWSELVSLIQGKDDCKTIPFGKPKKPGSAGGDG